MKKIAIDEEAPSRIYFRNGEPDPAGDFIGAGLLYARRPNDWLGDCSPWSFPYYALHITPHEGQGIYRNDNFECELKFGHFFVTFPGDKQYYGPGNSQQWGELYVMFQGKVFDLYARSGALPRYPSVWMLDEPSRYIEQLQEFLCRPRPANRMETAWHVSYFLNLLFGMFSDAEPALADEVVHDWYTLACRLLTADLRATVNYRAIADHLGMSYHTFRLSFAQRAGTPPAAYRENARFQRACELLVNNPHKLIMEIANDLGYASNDYFSTRFKNRTGMTPNAYRRRNGKSDSKASGSF
jgi:AraC-like DNA-binding protein